jgi:porin
MMADSRDLLAARLVGALCVCTLLAPAPRVAADQWPADIQFASYACGGEEAGCGDCCDSGCCDSACCDRGPCGCGCDCCWCRENLLGDMWGIRPGLAESGIVPDLELTQFYQGVTSGGQEQTFAYGGKMDYIFAIDGHKLGLWEGLYVSLHAETRFGDDVNLDAAGLAPVNANMLYPADEHVTAITGLLVTQAFSEEWSASAGKFNLLDLFAQLYPQTGRGIDGFMNLSSLFPISVGRPLNLSMTGAGVTKTQACLTRTIRRQPADSTTCSTTGP